MTVQSTSPVGKNPFAVQAPGKGKGKAEGNPADPGFAALLAMLATPGQPQGVPFLNGETPPVANGVGGDPGLPGITPTNGGVLPEQANPQGVPVGQDGFAQALESLGAQSPAQQVATGEKAGQAAVTTEMPVTVLDLQQPQTETQPAEPPTAVQTVPAPVPETPAPTDPIAPVPPTDGGPSTPVDGEIPDPIDVAPTDPTTPPTEESGTPADSRNGRGHDPDKTRGLERAAEVSQAGEHRPVDAPNADKFPIPPASQVPPAGDAPDAATPSPVTGGIENLRGRYEPGRIMDAISRSLANSQDGEYTVTLQLHPERLGEVKLQLHLNGREVQAVLEVASAEARQVLQAHSQQLRQNLDQAGLTLANFEVSTGQNPQQQTPQDRRDAFQAPMPGRNGGDNGSRQAVQPPPRTAGAIEQIRNAHRRGGRLDTMA